MQTQPDAVATAVDVVLLLLGHGVHAAAPVLALNEPTEHAADAQTPIECKSADDPVHTCVQRHHDARTSAGSAVRSREASRALARGRRKCAGCDGGAVGHTQRARRVGRGALVGAGRTDGTAVSVGAAVARLAQALAKRRCSRARRVAVGGAAGARRAAHRALVRSQRARCAIEAQGMAARAGARISPFGRAESDVALVRLTPP